eukprot:366519-Chlamydomonas_euryale.AAC.6
MQSWCGMWRIPPTCCRQKAAGGADATDAGAWTSGERRRAHVASWNGPLGTSFIQRHDPFPVGSCWQPSALRGAGSLTC